MIYKTGLAVIPAPNSMKGSDFLRENPEARTEDIMWEFENKEIKAIIANIGGNDSIRIIPYIDTDIIKQNPKIFIGYSDVMDIHLLCYRTGLSTSVTLSSIPPISSLSKPLCAAVKSISFLS